MNSVPASPQTLEPSRPSVVDDPAAPPVAHLIHEGEAALDPVDTGQRFGHCRKTISLVHWRNQHGGISPNRLLVVWVSAVFSKKDLPTTERQRIPPAPPKVASQKDGLLDVGEPPYLRYAESIALLLPGSFNCFLVLSCMARCNVARWRRASVILAFVQVGFLLLARWLISWGLHVLDTPISEAYQESDI